MCGRYNLRSNQRELAELFGVPIPSLTPRFNIAPTQQVLSIRLSDGKREAASVRWGLVSTDGTHAVGFVQDGVEIPESM